LPPYLNNKKLVDIKDIATAQKDADLVKEGQKRV